MRSTLPLNAPPHNTIPITLIRNSAINVEKERLRARYLEHLKNSNNIELKYLYELLMTSEEKNNIIDIITRHINFRI